MHAHNAYIRGNGFGFIVHAIHPDRDETQVKLTKVVIKQSQTNPEIYPVEYYEWGHWGMGLTRVDVDMESKEVVLNTDFDFFHCYVEGKCVHSRYGGDIFVKFDGELNGRYVVDVEIFLPEYGETCWLGRDIEVTP
jgi:hypothetical protein